MEDCKPDVPPCWRKSKKLSRVVETQRQIPQLMAMRHQLGVMLAKGHKQETLCETRKGYLDNPSLAIFV